MKVYQVFFIITITILSVAISTGLAMNIPQQISYQGKLMENGIPVTGTKTFTFSFADTDWSEVHEDVQILNGIYTVVLGEKTMIQPELFGEDSELKLQIIVDNIRLNPEIDILSVGYAFVAHKAEIASRAEVADRVSNAIYVNENMYVGIGTDEPKFPLDINGGIRIGFSENATAGAIRCSKTNLEFHNGTEWMSISEDNSLWSEKENGIYYEKGNVSVGAYTSNSLFHIQNNNPDIAALTVKQNIHSGNYFLNIFGEEEGSDDLTSMTLTNNDDIIMVGYTYSLHEDHSDILIARINKNSKIIWSKVYSSSLNLHTNARSIIRYSEKKYIIAGMIIDNTGDKDILILCIDESGSILWTKIIGTDSCDEIVYSIQETNEGGFILSGNIVCSSNYDVLILKLDSSFQIEWAKKVGGEKTDRSYYVHETKSNSYVITGSSVSFSPNSDMLIFQLSENGDLDWAKIIGGNQVEVAYEVKETSNNEYIVTGTTNSEDFVQSNTRNSDIMLLKLDKNGNLLFSKSIGAERDEVGKSLITTSDEGYVVTGYTNSFGVYGRNKLFLIKFDKSDKLVWGIKLESNDINLVPRCIQEISKEGFYIGGGAERDFFISKIDKTNFLQDYDNYGLLSMQPIDIQPNIISKNTSIINDIDKKTFNILSTSLSAISFDLSIRSILEAFNDSKTKEIESFTISSKGNIGISINDPQYKLHVNGPIYGISTWGSSDKRWKTNLSPLNNSLNKISLLNGYTFNWDSYSFPEMNFPREAQIGLVAQEVEKVIPELVHTDDDGYKSVAYDKLTAVLVEAIKELKKRNEILSLEIKSLKNEVDILKESL